MERRGEKQINVLAEAAINKLNTPKNVAKGGWKECTDEYLFGKMMEETDELVQAVYEYRANPTPENRERVRDEAADVVNYAMMVADNCGALKITDTAHLLS